MVDNNKLPEKWCIKVTIENFEALGKWRKCGPKGVMGIGYENSTKGYIHSKDKGYWSNSKLDGFVEISFKDFERLVLGINKIKTYPIW